MTNRTPHHLEARMERALADVDRLARDRGLEDTYAMELFGLAHQVQAAVDAHARGLAEHAIEAIRRMSHELLRAAPKNTAGAPHKGETAAGPAGDTRT